MNKNYVAQLNAQLRYYFHIQNPENLSLTDWAHQVAQLEWVRSRERGSSEGFFQNLFKPKK